MLLREVWKGLAAALGVALLVLAPPSARALTLDDLVGGGPFMVGSITFSDFDVSIAGDLSVDLEDYPVQLLPDGFRLSGPLSVLFGDAGTILISYQVSAAAAILNGVSLFAPGSTQGDGGQAYVGESVLGPGNLPLASLFVYDVAGAGSDPSDAADFAPVASLSIAKTIGLASGTFATLPVVDQRFMLVPEPFTLVLVTSGLLGLAVWGRRRELVA